LEFLPKIKRAFLLGQIYMLFLAAITLFQIGLNHPVAIRFNYKLEPLSYLPAIVAVLILPALFCFVYYMTQREPEKLNQITYWIYCAMIIIIMAAQTFLCINSF